MKRLLSILLGAIALAGCHSIDNWDNDAPGNFDALWEVFDSHYCFFQEKGIDWDSVYSVYRPMVTPQTNVTELYVICTAMLDELHDGHVNLTTPFATSYYKNWWSDYPQNYDSRLVEEHYLHFGGLTRGGITYAMLPDSIGYMRYGSFSYGVGETTLDWAFALLSPCQSLIIDIRDNGGGSLADVETFCRRFIKSRTLAGYITHKSGSGHGDFSDPYPYYYDPIDPMRIGWDKPVVILTNRSCFSAANNFVSFMSALPQVTLVGDRTGGGSGMPFSSEIPCGWAVRFSGSPIYDSEMHLTENGIEPDIHVDLDPEAALDGIDTMLEKAIEVAKENVANS